MMSGPSQVASRLALRTSSSRTDLSTRPAPNLKSALMRCALFYLPKNGSVGRSAFRALLRADHETSLVESSRDEIEEEIT